jgi:hypothetical protein
MGDVIGVVAASTLHIQHIGVSKVVDGNSVSGLGAPVRSGKAPVLASWRLAAFGAIKNPHGPRRLAQCSLSHLFPSCAPSVTHSFWLHTPLAHPA